MAMQDQKDDTARQLASQKMVDGVMMTIEDVAALFGMPPTTVHKLQIPSLRIGRSLRFSPADVSKFIESCREPVVEISQNSRLDVVWFGYKYHEETNGVMPYFVFEGPSQPVKWEDIIDAVHSGKTVNIRPATPLAIAYADEIVEQFKANQVKGN
ncbi:DNA-binding protein [Herbaspirillum sp. HC18]|nr:DNA-binding protein [Herbaspirillum sp. HC18]